MKTTHVFRRFALIIAILVGFVLITEKGPIPIAAFDGQLLVGLLAIGVGIIGLIHAFRLAGFDPQPEPPLKTFIGIIAYSIIIAYGVVFVVPQGMDTLVDNSALQIATGAISLTAGMGGFIADLATRRRITG